MKTKVILAILIVLSMLITSVGFADDSEMFRRNVSKTPDQETERANLNHMSFYVPAQNSLGEPVSIEYYNADGGLVDTRDYAKPLVAVYIDELEHHEEALGSGGAGMGAHDAYAALSLDDGATWKRTNLSLSADLSSFTPAKPGINQGIPFPGDAHNMTFAIAKDKVLVGWISKYCDGGSPLHTMLDVEVDALQLATDLPDLYFRDIWGVAGNQGSVDYTLLGFPEVGEIPYSCVWSARGQLLLDDVTGTYDIVWTKAERLTSGRRDANRLEMNADGAAGFMMTWQEDPEGLRPGQGLGPGEGWSGAVVNGQTDLWYSFIPMDSFDKVVDESAETGTVSLAEYVGETVPKVAVPMAMPIRLTDNKMCKDTGSDPYCYVDFDDLNPYGATVLPDVDWDDPDAVKAGITQSEDSTYCYTTEPWDPPGDNSDNINLCVAEDERVLGGRVGASRPRVNVQPYDSIDDGETLYDNAWVIMGAEESKALGEGMPEEPGGTMGEPTEEDLLDIGKNMMYYSFDLLNPEFLQQGGMLNWPAVDPETEARYDLLTDDFGNEFYETEIARRFSHMSQASHQFGPSGISSVLIVKQGIINQGGPADIFLRLTKVPDDYLCDTDNDPLTTEWCLFDEGVPVNPYAYENLVCDEWVDWSDPEVGAVGDYVDGVNPRYLEGYCLSTGINVSGTAIVACDGVAGDCAAEFPWDGEVDGTFPKVTEWSQSGPDYGTVPDELPEDFDWGTLDDESWENPYDVAKGHRGFIDGDYIMMMYAWSSNWKANSVGNDHYNLYARRSFDGGLTWTTTPANYTHVDGSTWSGGGTTTCENYIGATEPACTPYAAGQAEQARNLSQLIGNKITILDPRYTPTGGIKMLPVTDLKETGAYVEDNVLYPDDVRDPSKYFIVYETGDNTTVAEGEAVPLDLFYSRAYNWGDDYELVEYTTGTGDIVEGFDWLEHDREDLSGEAANTANNAGTFYYVIWNQWQEDAEENVSDSDAIFRRLMFNQITEAPPTATILYQSTDRADYDDPDIVLVGSGKDNDRLGEGDDIIRAQWWVDDEEGQYFEGRTFQHPPNGFIPGKHDFSFKVQDNEGRWSRPQTVTIWIAEQFYDNYLPLVTR